MAVLSFRLHVCLLCFALPNLASSTQHHSGAKRATASDDEESVERLQHAQTLFESAASKGDTAEEKTIKSELAAAMSAPAKVGVPAREMPALPGTGCQPDLASCPRGWKRKGVLCTAGPGYEGVAHQLHVCAAQRRWS